VKALNVVAGNWDGRFMPESYVLNAADSYECQRWYY
jgi:hypothetical protein